MTPQEVKVWNWLREGIAPLGYHFRRQVAVDRFVVDFACLKASLIVEIDGEQHGRDLAIQAADRERDAILAARGYRVLRFANQEVNRAEGIVLATILAALERRLDGTASPDSPLKGEMAGAQAPDGGGTPAGHPTSDRSFASTRPSPGGVGSTRVSGS